MKYRRRMKGDTGYLLLFLFAAAMLLTVAGIAPAAVQDNPAGDMQILLEKIKADKKLLVSDNMQLTEKDYATQNMLRWFIDKQVGEEANCNEAIQALGMVGGSAGSLYMVDRHVGKRGES